MDNQDLSFAGRATVNGHCERMNYFGNHDVAALATVSPYVNPGKWLNISWLLKGVDVKSILLSIGISAYLLLAAGIMAGESEVMDRNCVHCRLQMAGIKSPDAPKSVRKIMRYHGVNVLKTSNEENFILYKGRWEKVSPERPT
jgi:hypothetical protein